MDRKKFFEVMAGLGSEGTAQKVRALSAFDDLPGSEDRMPVFFFGHGSPMNAIEQNRFTGEWRRIADTIAHPVAILCISAHWLTRGTWITTMEKPRTIHDFGGFPQQLFEVQYPAPGSPQLAGDMMQLLRQVPVQGDTEWGLDHGCWSVLKHLYPDADIPVLQMSIDYDQPASYHYELGKQLAALRNKGVLILGSGNMVHNLSAIAWHKMKEPNFGYDWAIEANEKMKAFIIDGNHEPLLDYRKQGRAFQLAVPTPDHYYPMLYALALQEKDETSSFFNDEAVMGSLTMTSFRVGV